MIERMAKERLPRWLGPLTRASVRAGITPTAVTLFGLVTTMAGAVLVGSGWLIWGTLLFVAGSAVDMLDGALARAEGVASKQGALVDSVADRISETAIWTAIAVLGADDVRLLAISGLGLGGSLITSYIRAKGEALGAYRPSGLLGRTERVILMGVALVSGWLVPVLLVLVLLIWVTVIQRMLGTWKELGRG